MATTVTDPGTGTTTTTINTDPSSGKTYTQEQVNQLISTEKKKLYGDIDASKNRVQALEQELATLRTKPPETHTPQQDAELKAKIEKLTSDLATANQTWEQKLSQTVETVLTTAHDQFQKQRMQDRVLDRKDAAIKAADGKIIAAMVTGNTVEEVDASVLKAKEAWQQIYDAAKAEVAKTALPTPLQPGNNTAGQPDGSTVTDYRNLSESEWEQQKAKIKAETYKKVGLPMKT